MNAPKLRFKEFTDEYSITKVNKIVDVIDGDRGNNYPKENDFYETEFCLFLNAGNVTKNDFNFKNNQFITKEKDEKLRKGKLSINDIILTTRGTVGNVAWFNEKTPYRNIRINSGMVINRIKENENLLPEYLYSYMKSQVFKNQVNKMNYGSAQPQLTVSDINNFNIQYPTINEQKKVSTIMLLLDKKIELQSKKIEDLKLYKKGLNKTIFSNCTQKHQINDIITEYNKKTTINNQYDVLSSTASGIYPQNQYFNKQAASDDNTGYKIVPKGFITYRSMSDTGSFHFNIQNFVDYGIVSPAYPVFNINDNLVNKDYFVYYINENNKFKKDILSTKEGGTRYALSISKFKNIYAFLPSREEQNKLAKLLNTYNKKLDTEILKLNKLTELKKGLMQNMFV